MAASYAKYQYSLLERQFSNYVKRVVLLTEINIIVKSGINIQITIVPMWS